MRLLPAAPARDDARGMRALVQAASVKAGRTPVFDDIPPPPLGYEQAFRVTKAALPMRAYTASRIGYLVYVDAQGQSRMVTCTTSDHAQCSADPFDAATGLFTHFSSPCADLKGRDAIDRQLRALRAFWHASP